MVASKRCKVCASLDGNNVPISGEYFGKLIPDLIIKICGIEIDSRKASGVLICQPCVIQLIHTDLIIEKLRNALQRLKKIEKERKPKTPLKHLSTPLTKIFDANKTVNESDSQNCVNQVGNQSEKKSKASKVVVRRKSLLPDAKTIDTINGNIQNEETPNEVNDKKFKKILDEGTPIKETPSKASKRKETQSTNQTTSSYDEADLVSIFVKRKKLTSADNKESPISATANKQNGVVPNNETSVEESKVKAMNCIICSKVFYTKSALREHIETAHMGEGLKACPHCSSEFRSQQKYESHVFSEKCKNTNHVCQHPNCNKRFKTVYKMEMHMQEKHSSENESGFIKGSN